MSDEVDKIVSTMRKLAETVQFIKGAAYSPEMSNEPDQVIQLAGIADMISEDVLDKLTQVIQLHTVGRATVTQAWDAVHFAEMAKGVENPRINELTRFIAREAS